MKEEIDAAKGGIFHTQGNYLMDIKLYSVALRSFAIAGTYYIDANDEVNLGRVINLITDDCLPNIYNEDFVDSFVDCEKETKKLLSALQKYNVNGRYLDRIRNITSALKLAQKRKKHK